MKSICLCIKIHFPVLHHQFQFDKINSHARYFDDQKTENHVKVLARNNLLPFFDAVQNLRQQFGDRFKIAVSVSGIAIQLLEKIAPHIIEELKSLAKNGCIEFLAETWSHSLLPFFDRKTMEMQIDLHRKTIQSVFGQTPLVFIANSPVYADNYLDYISTSGCNTIFAYSNYVPDKTKQQGSEKSKPDKISVFRINQKLSQKLQNYPINPVYNNNGTEIELQFTRYISNHTSLAKPLILVYNPLQKSLWFNSINSRRWQTMLAHFLNNTTCAFYSPSDLIQKFMHFHIDIDEYSENMLSQFKISNLWLKNELQKDAFKQLHIITTLIRNCEQSSLTNSWNLLQDMNNLYYMGNQFFSEEYSCQNFSPFHSPYEAFMNYMNMLDDFWQRLKERNLRFSKNYSLAFNLLK